jgi:hypothetical protein
MSRNGTPPQTQRGFEESVERALTLELKSIANMEPAERIKLLAVATRYVAIKARLVTGEHGSGFEEDLDLDK